MTSPVTSWLVAFIIGLITFYLVKLWMQIRSLPPGPLPIPIIGNLLMFRTEKPIKQFAAELKQKYGGMYTLWLAHLPFIVVADSEISKEGLILNRNDFISRPQTRSMLQAKQHTANIIFEDSNRSWEVARKVGAGAVRKFADSEFLATFVNKAIDNLVEKLLKQEDYFDPVPFLQETITRIIATTAFGVNVSDEDMNRMNKAFDDFHRLAATPSDVSPLLLLLYRKRDQELENTFKIFGRFISTNFAINKKTFKNGELRNFSDAVISSGLEAENEDRDSKEFLHESKIWKIVGDLFLAGTDTSVTVLSWIILLLGYYPKTQERIRKEILDTFGSGIPTQDGKSSCPYTWAFISETLRFRVPVPFGVGHATARDTTLRGYKLKKGTTILFHLDAMQSDPKVWDEPELFKPERFLKSDGSYNVEKMMGFVAFGEGKRACIGEKLARNDLFLLMANLLQKVDIKLDVGDGIVDLEPQNLPLFNLPKSYKIIVNRRY